MSTLSLCTIVRNESARIERFIDQNLDWCDEIILVDTGSTDDTRKKIASRPVTLLTKSFDNDFSSVRNHGLGKVTSDWIVALDCDECIDKPFRDLILRSIGTSAGHAFLLPFITVQGSLVIAGHKVSLFRNDPAIRYDGIVHEQVVKSIRRARFQIAALDAPVYHFPPIGRQKPKNDFYRSLLKLEASADPNNPRVNYFLALDALSNRSDAESALKYHVNGTQGEVSECEWPAEYIHNAFSAAKMLRPVDPSSSLKMLQKALDAKRAFENDPIVAEQKELLFAIQAMHLDVVEGFHGGGAAANKQARP